MQPAGSFSERIGLRPSLYVAGDNLHARQNIPLVSDGREVSRCVRSFSTRSSSLGSCTDPVPVLPLGCLLEGVHVIAGESRE